MPAVASIINAIDAVMNKEFDNAFCVIRPPGHHAEKEQAMGFCLFNNVAVGATYLLEKYNKLKIIIRLFFLRFLKNYLIKYKEHSIYHFLQIFKINIKYLSLLTTCY